eukprot:s3573_g5.t1
MYVGLHWLLCCFGGGEVSNVAGGFRARWRSRGLAASSDEMGTPHDTPESVERFPSVAGRDDWEEVGLEVESSMVEEEEDVVTRLRQTNAAIDRVQRVTLEEVESYWAALPSALREMVSEAGEVQPDLLTYLVDDDKERQDLLRTLGCTEAEVKEKALVLEALQLVAAESSSRLRRNRIAKRGATRALEEARAEKLAKQAETAGVLLEGEEPTRRWLGLESGAVALPRRRRRTTDVDLPEGTVDEIQLREKARWEKEAARTVELTENMDLPIGELRNLWGRRRAPPSVPQAFASTLAFFERAGGIKQEQRLSEDPTFRRALDHTNKEMEMGRPDKRPAPVLPLKVIAAMELLVMNPAAEAFVRFAAWTKLVKVSITGHPWLRAGMDVIEEKYWYPRDYLVPSYPESLEDLDRRRPASYDDFVLMTRLVYSRLKDCQFDGTKWVTGRSPLLLPDLYRLWTEHSERNWLISMAASTQIHREERQALGRWAVKNTTQGRQRVGSTPCRAGFSGGVCQGLQVRQPLLFFCSEYAHAGTRPVSHVK